MKVYAVYENSDKTEGRGPMVINSVWENEDEAWAHCEHVGGVMGCHPHNMTWRESYELNKYGEVYGNRSVAWDWSLREMKDYKVTVNVIEYGRTMTIQAKSKAEAIRMVKAGDWPEEGTCDPESYRTVIVSVEEEPAK